MNLPVIPFTAGQLVELLRTQVGQTPEQPPGSNSTAYGASVGMNPAPWCAILDAWAWRQLGASWPAYWAAAGTPLWAYVPSLEAAGRAAGLSVAVASAQPGDLLSYAIGDGHIGVCVGWESGQLLAIEGNTVADDDPTGARANGGGVYLRHRPPSLVRAVLRPAYATEGAAPSPAPAPPAAAPVAVPGAALLPLAVDGAFGPKTKAALQAALDVAADGIIGPITRTALQRALGVVPDGVWGTITARALQYRVGAVPDGAWGPNTTAALQRWLNAGHHF